MSDADDPLSWWDSGGPRRVVAISFLCFLFALLLGVFPSVSHYYDSNTVLRNFLAGATVVLGIGLAYLELRHSGEANLHRAELNRLTGENNRLQGEELKLKVQIYQLQEGIEKKLTKVRLYARVHIVANEPHLFVSNLSEFDLWINQVEVIVTAVEKGKPDNRTIGGATRLSRGHMEEGFKLNGALMAINGNRTERMNATFRVKVVATGIQDDPIAINSPEYQVIAVRGQQTELKVLNY